MRNREIRGLRFALTQIMRTVLFYLVSVTVRPIDSKVLHGPSIYVYSYSSTRVVGFGKVPEKHMVRLQCRQPDMQTTVV